MPDVATENYKKSVARIVDRWSNKLDQIGKDMAPVLDELATLAKARDADQDRIAVLRKQMDGFQARMDKAGAELRIELMLVEPPKNADPKEVKKLPDWMQQIIKKQGIPLGKSVSVEPDVDIDYKTMKLKKCVVTFKVDLP